MNKWLSLLFLVFLAIPIIGQEPQPTQPERSETTKAEDPPTPTPTPDELGPDAAKFDAALAAPTNADKARLLRAFLDEYPNSELRPEAVSYLVIARAAIGQEKLKGGDKAGAVESFKLAVADAEHPISDRLFNDVLLKIPGTLFHSGERQASAELAQMVEKKVAAHPRQLLNIAAYYLSLENGSDAKRVAEAAIAADPASAAGYQALGLANRLNFDIEASAAAYSKAAELDPASIPAQRSLAELKRALGRAGESVTIYRSLLAANENDSAARTGLVLALFDSGKQAEAEAELARAIEREPKNFNLLAGVGYWYAANKQPIKAVDYAQKAVDAEPRYVWGHIALARGLMGQNKPVDAERALIKAKLYGNFPMLDYELASARFAAGLYREAVEGLAKSFTVKDGLIQTSLGGRVPSESRSFAELAAYERKASLLQATGADDPAAAEKLRLLFEFNRKINGEADEAEVAALADEFVSGDDKMKLHRQLYVADVLLNKNIALTKAAELVKGSVGNADAGLDVSAPSAAVMASELYESRTVAFSRNEVVLIPEVPRQTLSAILRGRIEELAGWTLFQQKNYPEAVVRLKRSVAVLPEKSAWWRASMWRLGSALEADGKEKEALDAYMESYKADRPNGIRYSVIESVYRRVNGGLDGLEDKIGRNPMVASAPVPPQTADPQSSPVETVVPAVSKEGVTDAAPAPQVPARRIDVRRTRFPSSVPAEPAGTLTRKAVEPVKAAALDIKTSEPKADTTIPAEEKPAVVVVEKAPEETPPPAAAIDLKADQDKPADEPAVKPAEKLDVDMSLKSSPAPVTPESSRTERPADVKVPALASEKTAEPLRDREIVENPREPEKKEAVREIPTSVPENELPASRNEKDNLLKPEAAVPIDEVKPAIPAEPVKAKDEQLPKDTAVPAEQPAQNDPVPEKQDAKALPVPVPEPSAERSEPLKSEEQAAPEIDRQATENKPAEAETAVTRTRRPVVVVNDPLKPKDTPAKRAAVVIKDPLPAETKQNKSRDLFEPIVITVPRTWVPKEGQKAQASDELRAVPEEKETADADTSGKGVVRTIEGRNNIAGRQCSIDVSDEAVSVLRGGAGADILVTVSGDAGIKDVEASTSSANDIEVRAEPGIKGSSKQHGYAIRSVGRRTGIFQVSFDSPCGKRDVVVRVR